MTTLQDSIRFRCEKTLKPRLQKAIRRKFKGRAVHWQTKLRDIVHEWVENEEATTKTKD